MHDVTFDQYDACIEAGGCVDTCVGADFCKNVAADQGWGRRRRPVINVNWYNAKQYAKWLSAMTGKSYRLLSEAEWEYAARAGSDARWSFGDDLAQLGDYAWFKTNSGGKTHPVGDKKPNAFGFYDMHGNVYQWVEDCYTDNYNEAPADGQAVTKVSNEKDCKKRAVRGGSGQLAEKAARGISLRQITRLSGPICRISSSS